MSSTSHSTARHSRSLREREDKNKSKEVPPSTHNSRYQVKRNDSRQSKQTAPVREKDDDRKKQDEKSLILYQRNPWLEQVNQQIPKHCTILIPSLGTSDSKPSDPKAPEPQKYDFTKPREELFLDMMYVGCRKTMKGRKNRGDPYVDMAYFAAIICPQGDFWWNTANLQSFCRFCEEWENYWALQKDNQDVKEMIQDLEDVTGLSNWAQFLDTTKPNLAQRV